MTLLNDMPPGATAGPAEKPEVPRVGIPFPYPTMAQRAEAEQAAKPPVVRLPIPFLAHGPTADGVVDSTLSERGAALAGKQQQAAASGEGKQAASATAEAAEKLVATAAKAMGLDDGEAAAAAEIPAITGGSPEHLLQDQDRELSKALAGAPHAKLHATEAAAAIGKEAAGLPTKALQGQANQQVRAQLEALPVAGQAPAKPARRNPMPMVQRLKVMELVRAAPPDVPDAELATAISTAIDRAVGSGTVKDYRLQLGLKSVPMPSKAELRAKLVRLEAELAATQQPSLPGV